MISGVNEGLNILCESGKANGEALMNIPDDQHYIPCWKAQYAKGKLMWKKRLFDVREDWIRSDGTTKEPTWRNF